MKESFENSDSLFVLPDLAREEGEFERVAKQFGIDSSVLMFQAQDGKLKDLHSDTWDTLENTDSNKFGAGQWDSVEEYANMEGRDYVDLRQKLESRSKLDAPIIMKCEDRYHLVSGNTRLMVARALGITPKVLLFEVENNVKAT